VIRTRVGGGGLKSAWVRKGYVRQDKEEVDRWRVEGVKDSGGKRQLEGTAEGRSRVAGRNVRHHIRMRETAGREENEMGVVGQVSRQSRQRAVTVRGGRACIQRAVSKGSSEKGNGEKRRRRKCHRNGRREGLRYAREEVVGKDGGKGVKERSVRQLERGV